LKYEPDASFWHDDAEQPGAIEVAYSRMNKKVDRLAEEYHLDSDAMQYLKQSAKLGKYPICPYFTSLPLTNLSYLLSATSPFA
jgi:hypothetical protein